MPAFSLYLRDDQLSRLKQLSTLTGRPVAKLVQEAVSQVYPIKPSRYVVGRDRVAWSTSLPLAEAQLARAAAITTYPGIVLYQVDDTTQVTRGEILPDTAVEYSQ